MFIRQNPLTYIYTGNVIKKISLHSGHAGPSGRRLTPVSGYVKIFSFRFINRRAMGVFTRQTLLKHKYEDNEQGLTLLSGRNMLSLWYGDSSLNAFP